MVRAGGLEGCRSRQVSSCASTCGRACGWCRSPSRCSRKSKFATSVPNLGVTLAGVAVTIDLVLLLLYLDRFVHALRPVAVATAMARYGLKIVADFRDVRGTGDGATPSGRRRFTIFG